jgi:hypothetical protein
MTEIRINEWVNTPRFLKVRIIAIFADSKTAKEMGYTEGTDYQDDSWHIKGRFLGANRMEFAAIMKHAGK